MQLSTVARDCLYLNWALLRSGAPPLPPPLRYEHHRWNGEDWIFASALLFRLSGLRLTSWPFLGLSYPQMNLRLYVLDENDVASVLFVRTFVPFWVVPVSRLLSRQPATPATFAYPPSIAAHPPSIATAEVGTRDASDSWMWRLGRGVDRLEVTARLESPAAGHGPPLGSWERTVGHFRRRRGYALLGRRLRAIRTSHSAVETWPLAVELGAVGLLSATFNGLDDAVWHRLHSAWLCPQIPFRFELGAVGALPWAPRGLPTPEGC